MSRNEEKIRILNENIESYRKNPVVLEKRSVKAYPKNIGKSSKDTPLKKNELYPLPSSIYMETTGWCNNACSFCPSSFLDRPRNNMPEELFRKIINDISAVDFRGELHFHQSNDPLTDERIIEHVEYAKSKLKGKIGFLTNGIKLKKSPELLQELYEAGLDFIHLEIYSGEPLYSDIVQIAKSLKETNRPITLVTSDSDFSFIKAKEGHRKGEFYVRVFNKGLGSDKSFTTNQRITSRAGLIGDTKPKGTHCGRPFRQMHINWDGTVLICCEEWLHDPRSIVGDFNYNNFVEIWNGEKYNKFRRKLQKGDRSLYPCDICNYTGGMLASNVRNIE